MTIRVCPLCQAEFLEFKTVCSHCGVALLDPDDDTDPRHLAEEDQVVYDLSAWPLDAQADAAEVLALSGIPHVWDGTDVLLPLVHEASADQLLEQVEQDYGLDGDEDDEDDGPGEPGGEGAETEYDMVAWAAARRVELVERLVEVSVPHRWEGDLLLVPTNLEDVVDDVLDEMEDGTVSTLPGGDEDAVEMDPAEILSELFLAAERMRKNKVDVDNYGGLLACLEAADPQRAPYGFDPVVWARALMLGEELADAVADDADEVPDRADELFQLLRPYV